MEKPVRLPIENLDYDDLLTLQSKVESLTDMTERYNFLNDAYVLYGLLEDILEDISDHEMHKGMNEIDWFDVAKKEQNGELYLKNHQMRLCYHHATNSEYSKWYYEFNRVKRIKDYIATKINQLG